MQAAAELGVVAQFVVDWFMVAGSWAIALSFYWQLRMAFEEYDDEIRLERVQADLERDAAVGLRFWQWRRRRAVRQSLAGLLTQDEQGRLKRYKHAAWSWAAAFGGSLAVATASSAPIFANYLNS